jgi:hypothetical protein
MRKALIVIAAFVAAAIVGVILTLLMGMVAGTLQTLSMRDHSGLGAVAGGISEIAVMMVPVLCGVIGMFIVLPRFERKSLLS